MKFRALALVLAIAVPAIAQGWTPPTRQIILVVDGVLVAQNIYWHQNQELQRYALNHPGTFVVFGTGGPIHRIDSPAILRQAQALYAPLVPLAAEQQKLAEQQKALALKQAELAKAIQSATGPENVGKIGQQQEALGQRQGQIGQEQGRVGQLQGAAWKVLQAALDQAADSCLADKSCPIVQN